MAKFIYLGKKKNFKLDRKYTMQTSLNPNQTFELSGKDLVFMRQAMVISEASDEGSKAFKLLDDYEMDKAVEEETEEETEETIKPKKRGKKPKKEEN